MMLYLDWLKLKTHIRDIESNKTGAGHACGHHLFGAGSAWAAVIIKDWLEENNIDGRIRYYGTPAEEGGSGKVYMVRAGLFDDVDIVFIGIQMIQTQPT